MGNELSGLKNKAKSDASGNRPDGEAEKSAEETDQTGRSFNLFARRLSWNGHFQNVCLQLLSQTQLRMAGGVAIVFSSSALFRFYLVALVSSLVDLD